MQVYFIKNVEDYNPKDLKTEVLLDDWRIVCAWWSLIKQGKKFKYSKNDILRLARKIAEEMRRRGIKFHPETMKEASRELLELVGFEKYATVHRSAKKLGRKITLGEVLDKWEKPIVIKKGFVRVIGGLANHGATEGDIDVLIAWPENTPMEVVHPIVFRLGRALGDLARRMQVNLDRYHGPFTSHVDVYDLVLVPSEQKVVEMSEGEVKFATLRDPQAEKEALQSRKENRIEPLRFFLPLKAVKGYHEGEVYRVEDLLDWFTDRDYPLYVQKKYDGLRIIWMKDGDKVIARTDDGTDVTARFPQLVEQLKRLPVDKVTLDSEVEGWTGEHHWGREEISGYVHEKGKPDDSMCIANVFDVLYVEGLKHHDLPEGDLHEIPYERRYEVLKYLASIGKWLNTSKIPTKLPAFNLTPSYIVTKPSELKEALEKAKNEPYSEGAMIKSSKGLYPLTGVTRGWLKFKTSADIHAVVIERIPTKTEGVYNYRIGLIIPPDWKVPENKTVEITLKNGKKARVMDVGKTFNSKLKLKQGDIITVLIHTLFYHVTPEGRYVTVYEPKVKEYRPNQIIPDDAETALNVAKAAKILQVKGEMQTGLPFVIQHHYRGKSCHIDFRYKVNNHLEGFTIADQEPGMIKEDVTSVAQAKKLDKNPRLWKHEAGTKLLAIPKAPEPVEWLSIEGTVPPGEVGATKYEYGVFTILDKGTVDLGAQKPYFKEFFLHGKKFKGRYVFRQLSNIFRQGGKLPPVDLSSITREHLEQLDVNSLRKIIRALRKHLGISKMAAVTKPALINEIMKLVEELQRKGVKRIPEDVLEPLTEKSEFIWLFWKPADQTPYVLSKRAVEKGWVPPYLQSALPREIERKIPKKFKYWLHKDENTRRTIRDQLVQAIHEGEVKLSEPPTIKAKEGEFVLQWHWWKERKLIRAGPSSQHWDLRIKVPGVKGLIHFVLADNPGYTDEVSAYYKECKDEEWMKKGEKGAEYLPPGTEGNPTKATDAWIEVIDKGKVEVLELNPQFGKFNFHGELLNGLYTVESEDGLYVFKKSEVPK